MSRKLLVGLGLALAALTLFVGNSLASVTVDPATGTGFVGKGDVQLVAGWNNKALQDNANLVDFRVNALSETSWTCTKVVELGNGGIKEIVQQRNQTTSTQGVLTTVARDNSKGKDGPVTGFYLNGFDGPENTVVDGPAVGSCPANPSGFVYDDNAVTTQLGGGIEVTTDGGATWHPIA